MIVLIEKLSNYLFEYKIKKLTKSTNRLISYLQILVFTKTLYCMVTFPTTLLSLSISLSHVMDVNIELLCVFAIAARTSEKIKNTNL